jgi:hypothetical protein
METKTKLFFDKKELTLDALKLTMGLKKTLFLNGLGFWNLQPNFNHFGGDEKSFCKAWAKFMGVEFDGNPEEFYNHFNFDISDNDKGVELTMLIAKLVDRDIEPVVEVGEQCKPKSKRSK